MRRVLFVALAPAVLGILTPGSLRAQGENAEPLRPGALRITVGGTWAHATDWFGKPNLLSPTLVDGARQPLGTYFSSDSLGVAQLPFLDPLQSQLRGLTGLNGYLLNIGRSVLTLETSVRSTPLRIDYAPTRRLALSVSVPLVRTRTYAALSGPDTGTAAAATRGNIGLNVAGATDAFRSAVDTALRALREQAQAGPAALRSQAQGTYDAWRPYLCGLYTLGGGNSVDLGSPCFGVNGAGPATFLPVSYSEAGDSLSRRLGRAETDYQTLSAQFAAQGVTLPPLTEVFPLPDTTLDTNDLRRFFSDGSGVLAGDSLTSFVRTGIGDMELAAWYQLIDRPALRTQLQVLVRLPTGTVDSPDNFIDVGTGDHQTDVEVALRNDLVFGRSLWLHVGGRYGRQMADDLVRRVSPWYLPLAPASSRATVHRQLGDYLSLDLVPNWQLDDAFGVAVGYHFFHQAATQFSYADPADEARIGLPADKLGEGTGVTRMRVGAGVTFSTVKRYAEGHARMPLAVTWSYQNTFWGRGGQVPQDGVMTLQIQLYLMNGR